MSTMTSILVVLVSLAAFWCGLVAPQGPVRVVAGPAQRSLFNGPTKSNARLSKAINGNESHFDEVLKNIMVPRVVGTPSHQRVKEYIIGEMRRLNWYVETDAFDAQTPIFGKMRFENIIAKVNPSAKQMLVLACHYDSKYFPNMEFLGATDSAVPCAMLINLAQSLQEDLQRLKNSNTGLELWFFDGEEAFQRWGPNDSIYGARHLASKMERENTLGKIKLFVLLDLLGTPGPYFYSYFPASQSAYRILANGEKALQNMKQLKAVGASNGLRGRRASYFHEKSVNHFVEDDHIPFLERGVPVLHIIPREFPDVWHTEYDDWDAIDRSTIEDLNKIFRMFLLNFFDF